MADPMEKVGSILELFIMLALMGGIIWAAMQVYGLFKKVNSNDPTGIKKAANSTAIKAADKWRSLFNGGKTSLVSEDQLAKWDIPEPAFSVLNFVPDGINTAYWTYEPDQVIHQSDGTVYTGVW